MAKKLKMDMPTATQHKIVVDLIDDAIKYNSHQLSFNHKVRHLEGWREKYLRAYRTATER